MTAQEAGAGSIIVRDRQTDYAAIGITMLWKKQKTERQMKYFTLTELSKSDTARRNGISNQPDSAAKANLYALVDNILDPLRAAYGKPITVNSGYRCQSLNRLVGGASTSQHLYGQAADIEGVGRSRTENRRLFELIQKLDLPFDQLINEFNFDWVHVSFRPNPRRQVLESKKKTSGKTYYVEISQNKPF